MMARSVVMAVASAAVAGASQLRSDEEIRQILTLRGFEQHVGIVIAPDGRKIFAAGSMGMNDPRPVDGDTHFEAGSITSVERKA